MTQIYDSKTTQAMISTIRKAIPIMIAKSIVGVQPMTPSNGSIFNFNREWGFEGHNKKYWPYQYSIDAWSKVSATEQWCWQNFKGRNWRNVGRHFAFKRKEDAALFLLKWS